MTWAVCSCSVIKFTCTRMFHCQIGCFYGKFYGASFKTLSVLFHMTTASSEKDKTARTTRMDLGSGYMAFTV